MEAEGFHDLVRRAQAGDRSALDRLLAALRPELERMARGYADPERPDQSTSDLVQDASLRAWQKLEQFRGGPDDEQTLAMFRAWVGQIVRNLGLNMQRDRKAQRRKPPQKQMRLRARSPGGSTTTGSRLEPAGAEPTPSANVRSDEQAQLVRAALDRIPDTTDRQIVQLHFFDGLSLRQIAERLKLSYDQVRERYHRGMQRLERELGGLR